ncbi:MULTISPECIES: PA1136 family autoinducer-binding transcriptional regulator [Bosea]|uniref:PA1136 family autoinducer-binding transcriptional regulator n=1 Tax=Bosea TaxID=85413 RepID=UPI0021501E89|nr:MULTISPECIES: PA1136 family autoinducer-binding transcriptional regulator [Bosea]MCR4524738.1 autoinducer binding domain-containing protein [Bosea sp. 47.2.35]MDR6831683.1 LuxR family transcriptional regulator (chaperone HchA-associated) [Bosea robiniae]MDR6898391.1 LuxR family transcriptional regulator (chaperone HchA-associated) [Bosea sp. BE109]MDR7141788.1 LuxR family transcriptional regulator (chaperone HchA-associated) [Bosea sp. BE168]MDR7178402.1 LuxR family transcriptional regulato
MTIPPNEAAIAIAVAIEGAESLPAIQQAVRTFAASFGYDRFVLFSASSGREDVLDRIYWVEGDWFGDGERVDAETYVRHCPVTRHIIEVREPFFWTKTREESGELYRVVRSPRGRGIHGLQIPVFGSLGLEGAMSLGGERIDSSPRARVALSLVAGAAFLAAQRLLEAPAGEGNGELTRREREILAWTAAGRRQGEIAATLGLSGRTIENHLRRIRKRLGVATTAQAIRVAIRTGEITA